MHSIQFSSFELLRGKFKNGLEISGKLREFTFSKMWPPCHNTRDPSYKVRTAQGKLGKPEKGTFREKSGKTWKTQEFF